MIREFNVCIHVPGAMSADLDIRWNAPDNCTLLHVSGVTSNDAATLITVGDETTAALHLASWDVGAGANTVHEKGDVGAFSDFATTQFPRIADGDTIVIAVDYDGEQGTSGADLTLVLRFAEG